MAIPDRAIGLQASAEANADEYVLGLFNEERVRARSVVIASGARYRRLNVPNLDEFEASSVHYWASPLEGKLCAGQEVALVGAGNSAGQATVYLASRAAKVWLIVRGRTPASRSRYLVTARRPPNVEVNAGSDQRPGRQAKLETAAGAAAFSEEIRRPIRTCSFSSCDPNSDCCRAG
jgi:thioredoxin reductase (NADPH)